MGVNNMSLIKKERNIRRQAELIIKDYETHGSLSKEEKESGFYCLGALSILLEIVDTIHDITITEEELHHLCNKLQEIINKPNKVLINGNGGSI